MQDQHSKSQRHLHWDYSGLSSPGYNSFPACCHLLALYPKSRAEPAPGCYGL